MKLSRKTGESAKSVERVVELVDSSIIRGRFESRCLATGWGLAGGNWWVGSFTLGPAGQGAGSTRFQGQGCPVDMDLGISNKIITMNPISRNVLAYCQFALFVCLLCICQVYPTITGKNESFALQLWFCFFQKHVFCKGPLQVPPGWGVDQSMGRVIKFSSSK